MFGKLNFPVSGAHYNLYNYDAWFYQSYENYSLYGLNQKSGSLDQVC